MAFPNHIEITIPRENLEQNHDFTLRAQWLRAAVLGANDGFVSVALLMMGAGVVKDGVRAAILTFLAGLFASACSMAIGELVSASSQLEMKREEGSTYPFRAALESSLAFSLGAFTPILAAACITEYSFRSAVVVVAATTTILVAFGGLGAALRRSWVVSSGCWWEVGWPWLLLSLSLNYLALAIWKCDRRTNCLVDE